MVKPELLYHWGLWKHARILLCCYCCGSGAMDDAPFLATAVNRTDSKGSRILEGPTAKCACHVHPLMLDQKHVPKICNFALLEIARIMASAKLVRKADMMARTSSLSQRAENWNDVFVHSIVGQWQAHFAVGTCQQTSTSPKLSERCCLRDLGLLL